MKTTVIALIISAAIFSSCNKDDSDAPASRGISCTIDGVNATFNILAKAIRADVPGAYSVQMIGYRATAVSSDQIAIGVSSFNQIAAATYNEDGSANGGAGFVNLVENGNAYPYISYVSPTNPATITITAISSSSIQGTFKGDIFLTNASGVTTTKKVITNGQFNVNF